MLCTVTLVTLSRISKSYVVDLGIRSCGIPCHITFATPYFVPVAKWIVPECVRFDVRMSVKITDEV